MVSVLTGKRGSRSAWFALVVITALWSLYTIAKVATPGIGWMVNPVVIGGPFLIVLSWAILLGMTSRGRPPMVGWAVVPVLIGLLTVILGFTGIPTRIGLAVSKSSLESYAQSITNDTAPRGVQPLGVFNVREPKRLRNGVRFTLEGGGGMLEEQGFAHLPGGGAGLKGFTRLDHISGPWYLWTIEYD